MSRSLSGRLASHFPSYQSNSQFIDCLLVDGQTSVPAHRIILGFHSRWFDLYFDSHPLSNGSRLTVSLPVNPAQILPFFVDILYGRRCEITSENVSALLKMAVFYDCPVLTRIFRYFVSQAVQPANVLFFVRRFLELGLEDDAIALAPLIAPQFLSLLRPGKTPAFSLEELFESVSPRLFAAIMSDPQLSEGAAELKDDDKVRLTDNYASRKGVLTEDGREALAKVVDWDSDTAFFHLVKHPCDWVAARCSRGLYARILRNRRASLGRFETELQNGARTVARWYPFAWLQLISDAGVRKVSPTVKLVSLVSTLGGLVKAIDPCAFGFVNLFYSVEPFAKQFAPANVFVPGKYFMATAEGAVKPMIGIDFGAAAFEVESVSVDAQAQPKGDKHPPKPVPAQVIFKAARSVQGCYRQNDHAAVAVKLKKGQSDGQLLQLPGQFSVIAVEFLESNTNGSDLARLVSFEVEGHFTNT